MQTKLVMEADIIAVYYGMSVDRSRKKSTLRSGRRGSYYLRSIQ